MHVCSVSTISSKSSYWLLSLSSFLSLSTPSPLPHLLLSLTLKSNGYVVKVQLTGHAHVVTPPCLDMPSPKKVPYLSVLFFTSHSTTINGLCGSYSFDKINMMLRNVMCCYYLWIFHYILRDEAMVFNYLYNMYVKFLHGVVECSVILCDCIIGYILV